jgi:ABC-2 type transport system permease protein
MSILFFLLQKEFKQIFRNRTILAVVLVMPVIQLIVLPLAADYEVKNINLCIVDSDRSPEAQRLAHQLTASGYFRLTGYTASYREALALIEADRADVVLTIPPHFERAWVREGRQTLSLAVNAINGVKAGLGAAYISTILQTYNNAVRVQWIQPDRFPPAPMLKAAPVYWYNPFLNYRVFMVPGILAVLVTMIGGFLSALNIVQEKEIGTIEQINVSPVKKHYFILGKLLPFWVLGNVVFTLGLLVARIVYGIVPMGNIPLLYGFVTLYLLAILGLGLLISTYCETQQQAMLITFFFMMVFILLGGLFTPLDSMPPWARAVANASPVTHLIAVMRMIILKGSTLKDVLPAATIVATMALILNTWAILNYRKTA